MLLERVDRDGRKDNGYGDKHTRLEWVVRSQISSLLNDAIDKEINLMRDAIAEDISSVVSDALKTKIKRAI